MGMFTETDAAILYETVINKLQTDVGETLYPGDERRIFAEGMIALFVVVFNTIDDTAKQNLLKYAREGILDEIGDSYDCKRIESEKATTVLRFYIDEVYTTDITIPSGTRAQTEDGHTFSTDREVIIEQGSLYVDVEASAIKGGLDYNDYLADSITIIVDLISYVDSVTNTIPTQGGTDEEKDDDYRKRIRLALNKFSTAGPQNAWKYWALSADSSIADAYIENPSANEIEISIILSDGSLPNSDLLAEVEHVVTAEDIKPLGDHVIVKTPVISEYDIDVTYYVSSENEATAVAAIEHDVFADSEGNEYTGAIKSYKLWQDTKISRNINPDKLRGLMMNPAGNGSVAGADRVEITSPSFAELSGATVAHYSGTINISHVVLDE